jgi:hypothetical protein
VATTRGIGSVGGKAKNGDKKGKKPEAKKKSLKKRDGFNPSPPLTLALLDEVWNKAEWAALTRETT